MANKLLQLPGNRLFNNSNIASPGGTATLYLSKTSTLANFLDASSVPLGPTITANGLGQLPDAYGDETVAYRVILRDSSGVQLDGGDIDPFYFGRDNSLITTTSGSSVSTRALLAAIANPVANQSAILTEAGREGTFVFSSANLSAQVTADTAQGIYVAPSSDTTGASGAWVRKFERTANVKWFGAVGDGVTDDVSAINQAIATCGSLGVKALYMPAATYIATTAVTISASVSNFELLGPGVGGATISSPITALQSVLSVAGDHILIRGLRIYLSDVTAANAWNVEMTGTNVSMWNCVLESPEGRPGTVMYTRAGADNFTMAFCETKGSNGFNIFTPKNHKYVCNKFVERASGGDDAIAVKAIYGQGDSVAENILIANNYFENAAGFVSIGSEIGRSATADPNYTANVRGVQVIGNRGKNCSAIAFIKPGGIQNYWDGTVDGVEISDNFLEDPSGSKMSFPVWIQPGRGGRVRNVFGKNNMVHGRTTAANGAAKGCYYFIDDFTSTASTAQSSISNVDVQLKIYDPWDGVAAGGSAPGSPFSNAVGIVRINPAYGTFSNITIDIDANACSASGIVVPASLDDVVYVRRAKLTPNINTGASNVDGGIKVLSRVLVSTDINITVAGGFPYIIGSAGDIICAELEREMLVSASQAAGSGDNQYVLEAHRKMQFVEARVGTTNTVIASDTNYTQLGYYRNGTANPFYFFQTKVTGAAQNIIVGGLTAGSRTTSGLFRNLTNTTYQNNALLAKGDIVLIAKTDTGTGAALTNHRTKLRFAPY